MEISITDALLPVEQYYIWDIILYGLMFFQLILLAVVFSGPLRDVIFVAVMIIAAFADKAYIFGFIEGGASTFDAAIVYHAELAFMTFIARVSMFVFATVLITQTKIKIARPLAVICALYALIYTFARWFTQQSAMF